MKMQMKNSRLVVTGMGAVTPIGIGVDAYWNNLVQGVCGVDAITRFDTENLPVKIAAEVKDFDPLAFMPKKLTREMDVFMQYGYAAAMEAIDMAGGDDIASPERMGITVGTALGGIAPIGETQDGISTGLHKKVSPRFVPKIIGNEAAAPSGDPERIPGTKSDRQYGLFIRRRCDQYCLHDAFVRSGGCCSRYGNRVCFVSTFYSGTFVGPCFVYQQ